MVNYTDIFKNKPQSDATWQLEISAQIGSMQGDQFTPKIDIQNPGLSLVIEFNDQPIMDYRLQSRAQESWQWSMRDQNDSLLMISVTLKGKSRLSELEQTDLVVKISINIEGFCLDDLIEHTPCYFLDSGQTKMGSCIMGEDGTVKFGIRLPVYRWIFDNAPMLEKNYQFYQNS